MKTIAMTLGPIVSTLSLGRKTSEIWAASYLFSLIMKKSVGKLRKIDGVQFIVPYAEDDALFDAKDGGIGRFHDRFILQSDTIDLETVRRKVDEARDEVADLVAKAIGEDKRWFAKSLEAMSRAISTRPKSPSTTPSSILPPGSMP